MTKLSVIFLSYAVNDDIYKMNCNAIDSLLQSESWADGELEIILIESCKSSSYKYLREVKTIVPEERFNFHRFFNIGLDCSCGEFVAFCNNDVLFEDGWFSAMMRVKDRHPRFMCFSPIDDKYPGMTAEALPRERDYYCGWDYGKYFAHGVLFGNAKFSKPLESLMKPLTSMLPMPTRPIHYVIMQFQV